MNGLRRLKVAWATTCLVLTSIVTGLLLFSTYRPELMHVYALCTLVAGSALAGVPFIETTLRNRALFAWIFIVGPLVAADAVTEGMPMRAVLAVLIGLVAWALWSAAEWVHAGFGNR